MSELDDGHAAGDERPASEPTEDARLDARRRLAETEKAEHEARKGAAEAEEAELRKKVMQRGSLTPRILTQAAVGGVVAAGLIAAWGIGYLQPMLEKKTTLALIENQIVTAKNNLLEYEKEQLERQKERLEQDTRALKAQQAALNEYVGEIEQQNEQLNRQIDQAKTRAENQLRGLLEVSEEADSLREQIAQLKEASRSAEARTGELTDLRLASYKIVIQEQYFEQPVGAQIAQDLAKHDIKARRVYTRGGGDDEVVWVQPRVDEGAKQRLLKILGPTWTLGEGDPHSAVGDDWDIIINPSPPPR